MDIKEVQELEVLVNSMKQNFPLFCEKCLKIVNNKGELIPFKLNHQQLMLYDKILEQEKKYNKVRIIVLKSRKLGISTFVAAYFIWKTIFVKHSRSAIVTHLNSASSSLFRIYKRFYDNLPDFFKSELKKNNTKELDFLKLDSSIVVNTAGSKETGRGDTLINLHCSEFGFFPNGYEIAAGLIRSCADVENTSIIIESTSNGINNIFYDYWSQAEKGISHFEPIFFPWTIDKECSKELRENVTFTNEERNYQNLFDLSNEQLYWRQQTILQVGEQKFLREYPITAEEAFRTENNNSFIDVNEVIKAQKNKNVYQLTKLPLIIGVDVALQGDDSTVFSFRRGNVMTHYEKYNQLLPEQIADLLTQIIIEDKPDKIFIDGTGGFGSGVASILRLRGYTNLIQEINFASSSLNDECGNRRAYMFSQLKKWLKENVSIPDSDELQQDLISFSFYHNIKNQLMIESKKEVKKRLKRSPDLVDSLALTFAEPVSTFSKVESDEIVRRSRENVYEW